MLLVLRNTKKDFLRYIGCRNFTNDHIKHVLSPTLVVTSLPSKTIQLNIVKKFMKDVVENLYLPIKYSGKILNKLKSRGFRATSLAIDDFSTLYTLLPHTLIKEKIIDLIERKFQMV